MFSLQSLQDEYFWTRCLFYYFKVLGLGTMKLESTSKKLNFNNQYNFVHSNTGAFYNFICINLIVVSNYFSIKFTYEGREKSTFEKIFVGSQNSLTLLTVSITQLVFVIKQNDVITMCRKIKKIRDSMEMLDAEIFSKTHITRKTATVFIIIAILWCPMIVTLWWMGTQYFFCSSAIYLSNFIASAMIFQYSTVLIYFEKLFCFVNDKLIETSTQPLVHLSKKYQLNQNMQVKNSKEDTLLELKKYYVVLYDISQDVTRFYSLPMLFNTLNIFMACILSAYYIAKPFVLQRNLLIPPLAHCAVYGIFNITLMLILTHSVHATVREVYSIFK